MSSGPKQNNYTVRQKDVQFMKALAKGNGIGAAAQSITDKKLKNARHSGEERLRSMRVRAKDLLDKADLGEKILIENYLRPLLGATEVKVFNDKENGIVYSKPLEALDVRTRALDMAFKLHGSYVAEKEIAAPVLNQITVIIDDVSRETTRTIAAETAATE